LISLVEETGSTNADLAAALRSGEGWAEGAWLVARRQSAGRGRQGREWFDGAGNFMGSTVVVLGAQASDAGPPPASLSFVAALAVRDACAAALGDTAPLGLKWPNDVLVDGGKVAGILLESAISQDGKVEHVVAGIGVNVTFAPQLAEMRYPGAKLGGTVEAALEGLARAFATRLAEWRRSGFEVVREAWLAKAGPLGADVDVRIGEELVRGRFAGLDREGALLLDTPGGPRKIVSGELLGRAA